MCLVSTLSSDAGDFFSKGLGIMQGQVKTHWSIQKIQATDRRTNLDNNWQQCLSDEEVSKCTDLHAQRYSRKAKKSSGISQSLFSLPFLFVMSIYLSLFLRVLCSSLSSGLYSFFSLSKITYFSLCVVLSLSALTAAEPCILTVLPEQHFIHCLWYCAINVTSSQDTHLQMLLWRFFFFFFLNILTQSVANSESKLTHKAARSEHLAMMGKQQQLKRSVCLSQVVQVNEV